MRLLLALLIGATLVLAGCGNTQPHGPVPVPRQTSKAPPLPAPLPPSGSGIRGVVTLDVCTGYSCLVPASIRIYTQRASVTPGGHMSRKASTDAAGDFSVALPPGQYVLFARDEQQSDIRGVFAVSVLAHRYSAVTLKLYIPSYGSAVRR